MNPVIGTHVTRHISLSQQKIINNTIHDSVHVEPDNIIGNLTGFSVEDQLNSIGHLLSNLIDRLQPISHHKRFPGTRPKKEN